MSNSITAISVGYITHDLYGQKILPGGSALYAAQTFKALGASSKIVSSVGKDFGFEQALQDLEAKLVRAGQTTTFRNLYTSENIRTQTVEGISQPITPEILPANWRKPDILFICPVLNEVDLVSWNKATYAKIVGIGVQGFVRCVEKPSGKVEHKSWNPRAKDLEGVDVAFLSKQDVIGQEELIDILIENVDIVVVTHGQQGADVYEKNRKFHMGIYKTNVIDPTGAGDCFAAGFMQALAMGKTCQTAAKRAAACASVIIEGQGLECIDRMNEAIDREECIETNFTG
jgi:sugar/nucleoside kinase (ribokinase family)